ncbi:MAG TPA: restriction endonuclease [Bacteroidetes bacterium]|nr:restriction endonuclease [Bacteroidota bacterium]
MKDNNLSYSDIAYKILKDNNVKSLHYKDIARIAFDLELIETDDLITAGNIASAINSEIKKATLNGSESRFIKRDRGHYGLYENEPQGIFAEIREKNNNVKSQLLKALMEMPPSRFEELVGEVLRKLSFEKVEVTGKSGDGGIDIIGEVIVGGVIRNSVCVQVKRWKNNIQRSDISQLRGSLRPHQTGLFITTSDFSKPSIDEANDPYKAPISLMNGKELIEFMCEFGIGVSFERVTILEIDNQTNLIDYITDIEVDENEGIEIFANYKGHKHFGIYFSPTKVHYNNEYYKSPSKAGSEIAGYQVNGWRFWKYFDKNVGKNMPLSYLRKN